MEEWSVVYDLFCTNITLKFHEHFISCYLSPVKPVSMFGSFVLMCQLKPPLVFVVIYKYFVKHKDCVYHKIMHEKKLKEHAFGFVTVNYWEF